MPSGVPSFALELGLGAGQLQRGFVGLGAAVAEEGAVHAGGFGQPQGELGLAGMEDRGSRCG